jgi:hypothetical protein
VSFNAQGLVGTTYTPASFSTMPHAARVVMATTTSSLWLVQYSNSGTELHRFSHGTTIATLRQVVNSDDPVAIAASVDSAIYVASNTGSAPDHTPRVTRLSYAAGSISTGRVVTLSSQTGLVMQDLALIDNGQTLAALVFCERVVGPCRSAGEAWIGLLPAF